MDGISKKERGVLTILIAGVFLGFLNQTLMNTALPQVMADFHISTALGQWMTNGYMLVNGVMVPLTAFLIQRLKTRTLYLSAVFVFAVGTLVAGFAPSYPILIMGRMIQAAGAGVFGPLMNVVVMNLFAADRRGQAMGIIGLALNFAPTIGPTLSGFVVSNHSWRWLFLGIAPLTIIDLILAFIFLKNIGQQKFLKFNFLGMVLSSIGLGSLLYGFSNAGTGNWLSPDVLAFLLIGIVVTALFVYQQTHSKMPLLNFDVFKYHNFTMATLINVVLMAALYGGALMLPLYMQTVRGQSAFISGLVLLPGALITALLSPTSGKWYDQFGVKRLAPIGLVFVVIGTIVLATLQLDSPIWLPAVGQFIRQLGLVMVTMPIQTEAFNSLPLEMVPDGSAMYTTIRQVAASFGTAALITVYSLVSLGAPAKMAQARADLAGIHAAFWIATGLVVLSLGLTQLFKQRSNA
ncbi:DHA2 family efflux MFS transporter permease subunit [Weissella confusa]|uniref:DHA2 family efflux MFS transporter permease subunit n=1 Tax=Weissella confusa TaxID=1583 RepID=UPI00107FB023|nr:DHA2 family efflux MFS transporter permease subunit [Weissella confusa]TGE83501.1 MFS transporter [Weissella confusa]